MKKTDGQQLNFNFKESSQDIMPKDITLDEFTFCTHNCI